MRRNKKSALDTTNIKIYQNELNLEHSSGTTYWILTEVINDVPVRTFYFKIPDSYKDNHLLGGMHERYCMYSPN